MKVGSRIGMVGMGTGLASDLNAEVTEMTEEAEGAYANRIRYSYG